MEANYKAHSYKYSRTLAYIPADVAPVMEKVHADHEQSAWEEYWWDQYDRDAIRRSSLEWRLGRKLPQPKNQAQATSPTPPSQTSNKITNVDSLGPKQPDYSDLLRLAALSSSALCIGAVPTLGALALGAALFGGGSKEKATSVSQRHSNVPKEGHIQGLDKEEKASFSLKSGNVPMEEHQGPSMKASTKNNRVNRKETNVQVLQTYSAFPIHKSPPPKANTPNESQQRSNLTKEKRHVPSLESGMESRLDREGENALYIVTASPNKKPAALPKYQYYQSDKFVTVSLLESNVRPENLEVRFARNYLTVKLKKGEINYTVISGKTYSHVSVKGCKIKFKGEKVLIKLKKEHLNFEWQELLDKKNSITPATPKAERETRQEDNAKAKTSSPVAACDPDRAAGLPEKKKKEEDRRRAELEDESLKPKGEEAFSSDGRKEAENDTGKHTGLEAFLGFALEAAEHAGSHIPRSSTIKVIDAMQNQKSDARVQREGCKLLHYLARSQAHRATITSRDAKGIEAILCAMKAHTDDITIQETGCRALCHLTRNDHADLQIIIAQSGLKSVLSAMENHSESTPVQSAGCLAIGGFACAKETHKDVLSSGGIRTILKSMREHEESLALQKMPARR